MPLFLIQGAKVRFIGEIPNDGLFIELLIFMMATYAQSAHYGNGLGHCTSLDGAALVG
jgi:hypothetical protein